jgi:hypothetical protein
VLGESVEGEEYGRHVEFGNRKRKKKNICLHKIKKGWKREKEADMWTPQKFKKNPKVRFI